MEPPFGICTKINIHNKLRINYPYVRQILSLSSNTKNSGFAKVHAAITHREDGNTLGYLSESKFTFALTEILHNNNENVRKKIPINIMY